MNGNLTKIKQKNFFRTRSIKKPFELSFGNAKIKMKKMSKKRLLKMLKNVKILKVIFRVKKTNNFASKKMCGQRQKSDENKQNRSVSEKIK